MSVIKKYWDSVYVYVLLLVPFFCSCAGAYWTICKLIGLYPNVKWPYLLLFDGSQAIYMALAVYFIYRNKKDSSYISEHLKIIKGFIIVILFIQYNLILNYSRNTSINY